MQRVALVTGGSRGIGRAVCLALHTKGFAVAVHYGTNSDAAAAVESEITQQGGQAVHIQADLRQSDAPDQLVEHVCKVFGRLDVLVNNAGIMSDASVENMSDAIWEETLAVNLSAVFRCTRACTPLMKAQGWGRLINVSSQAAYTGSSNHAHYAATKSALLGFTFSVAKELASAGITANIVVPGRIETDMLSERSAGREAEWLRQTPLDRLGQPREVAAAVAFLASDEASYITGAALHVNGGLVMG